jgi:hypothetical protein
MISSIAIILANDFYEGIDLEVYAICVYKARGKNKRKQDQ